MLWGPAVLVLVACGAILYYGHEVASTLRQSAASNARAHGQATAHEIRGFLDREHERLEAFVIEKASEIRSILDYPDNWPAIDALQTSVRRMFRGALAFTVTGADGQPLFEDFDGLVGPVCGAAMRDFAQAVDRGSVDVAIPPIHPVPDAFHFDLISPWTMEDGESGLFFISMSPQRIAELLAAAEYASGNRIVLVNRDDPTLIEISAVGSRDAMKGEFRLEPEALVAGHFSADLDGTQWRLIVLPDDTLLEAALTQVYVKVAALVIALLLISATLLLLIRRHEQRNSSLFTRSLQSSVNRQRAILQSMVDGMITLDAQGQILHVNHAVTRLFGYEPSELVGNNARMLLPGPDGVTPGAPLLDYLSTGEHASIGKGREVMARRKDGSLFPVLLTLGESVEGEQHIFVGILHDMSAYRDAQRKIAAQAMAIERSNQELDEIGQLASKDLQPPLQRIASLGESLGAGHSDTLTGHERAQLKSLTEEARDMSELVKGLVDYAKVGRQPVAAPVTLDAVLEDVQRDLAATISETGASIAVEPLGEVLGSPQQLHQVFWNLIDNALKFRDPDRPPEIRVSLEKDAERADNRITVLVQDNGIGIAQDRLDGVFEAFRRLHPRDAYPGMGLGLSFCRKIVEGLGGEISVTSTPGEGSTFRVSLPSAE
jgi:PAS domain S-box-containing protein